MEKEYLGDSVYVEQENGMTKLTTWNGYKDDPRNVIYMEDTVFSALLIYAKKLNQQGDNDGRCSEK